MHFFIFLAAYFAFACQTLREEETGPPQLQRSDSIDHLVQVAIEFGSPAASQAKTLIKQKKGEQHAVKILTNTLHGNLERLGANRFINAMSFYQSFNPKNAPSVFLHLLKERENLVQMASWQMATKLPSKRMARVIDDWLSLALQQGREADFFRPEVAEAIAANDLKNLYPFLRFGLMNTGHESFVRAMIAMNARDASEDFLGYLSTASVEELRQIHVSSVDPLSCLLILEHMTRLPPRLSHRNFKTLFLYAVSRNPSFSQATHRIIDGYLPQNKEKIALELSKLPVWVQIGYIETSQRYKSPRVRLLLGQLRDISAQDDVIDEIDNILR